MHWSVVGHRRVKKYFTKALKEGFSSHAYILAGNEGIGKRSLALDIIRAAHQGSEPGVNDPFSVVVSPNDKGTISIKEHIQPLRRALTLRPPEGTRTIVLIDDVERLSFDASHAVLKMLEEPPPYALFLLITSTPGQLPGTIRSRCLQVSCVPPGAADVDSFMQEQGVSQKNRQTLVSLAGGSIGWLKKVIDDKAATRVASSAQELDDVLAKGKAERLIWAKKFADQDDARQQVLRWMHVVRAQVPERPELGRRAAGLLALHEELGHSNLHARLAVEHFVLSA